MRIVGMFLRIGSFVVGTLGIVAGFVSAREAIYSANGIAIIAASVIGWAVLFGIGSAFILLEDIAIDTNRSADALEALAERRAKRPPTE